MSAWRSERALLVFALGSLQRRRGRSISLFVSLAFVSFLIASLLFVSSGLRAEYQDGTAAMPDLTVQRLVGGRPATIPAKIYNQINNLPAVKGASARVWGYLYVPSAEGNVVVLGAGHVSESDARAITRHGRLPHAGEVVLGEALASRIGVLPGDRLALPTAGEAKVLRVIAIFRSESALRTADLALTSDADARDLLGMADADATDLAIDLTTPDEAQVIAGHIARLVPGARVIDKRTLARTYELTFGARSGFAAMLLLPALASLLLLAWDRMSGVGEQEKREIGILKAIGWETSDVLRARMWESAVLSIGGAVWGALFAYAFVFFFRAPVLADALLGWSALHPPFDLRPAIALEDLAFLIGAVAAPFMAASLIPAWRAAMSDPDRAMRGAP